ncbi:MAG: DUF4399 domain-containing protein [Bdellovibrionales bacterium]|nr:DUF4399 domain-containing protein [Bdellovibrionales bacterium]
MKTILSLIVIVSLGSLSTFASQAPDPKAPKAPGEKSAAHGAAEKAPARVFFKNLKNGQTIPTKYKIEFGIEGVAVKPAGEIVPGTGHHHLIIDGDAIPAGQVVPADEHHVHFGKGQTEYEITLKPGKHKLLLQFADGAHISYGPELSAVVDVIVK